jgi:signal peptidase I
MVALRAVWSSWKGFRTLVKGPRGRSESSLHRRGAHSTGQGIVSMGIRSSSRAQARSIGLGRLLFWGSVAIGVASLVWVRTFWLLPVCVSQDSMHPTLSSGDFVLVDQRAYRAHPPRLGDIVIFPHPEEEDDVLLVKRVVGLPGDVLKITPWGLLRNGQPLAEWYLEEAWLRPPYFEIRIPKGYVFVMGDNRNWSELPSLVLGLPSPISPPPHPIRMRGGYPRRISKGSGCPTRRISRTKRGQRETGGSNTNSS